MGFSGTDPVLGGFFPVRGHFWAKFPFWTRISPFGDPDFPFLGVLKPGKSPVFGSPAPPENAIFGGFPGRQKGVFPGRGPHFGQKTPQNDPQKFSRPGQKKTPLFPPMVSRFSTLFGSVFGSFFPFYALVGPKSVSAGTPRNRLQKGILAQNRSGAPENAILGGSGRPKPGFLRFLAKFRKNAIFPN